MLILTRFSSQSIMIGDDIVVTVLDVKNRQVKIGISAPDDVDIHREEIYYKIQREKDNGRS